MKAKTLLAWSGGKDSAWALHLLRSDPAVEVAGLFTTMNEAYDRVAIHGVRDELLTEQARLAGAPLHRIPLPNPCSNAQYEAAMSRFVEEAKSRGVTHFAFGDLFLEDIRRYRERQMAGTGLELLFPIWGLPTAALAREMISSGLRAWIVTVDTRKVPAHWAGRMFDEELLGELPPGVDPCGENGEFHTFVVEGPMLRGAIRATLGVERIDGDFAYRDLIPGRPA